MFHVTIKSNFYLKKKDCKTDATGFREYPQVIQVQIWRVKKQKTHMRENRSTSCKSWLIVETGFLCKLKFLWKSSGQTFMMKNLQTPTLLTICMGMRLSEYSIRLIEEADVLCHHWKFAIASFCLKVGKNQRKLRAEEIENFEFEV